MNHPEAAISGLYDHEHEAERPRERRAPDWGADELFSSTPRRRRFDRDRERPHGAAGDRPRLRDTSEHRLRQPARPARRSAAEGAAAGEPAPAVAAPAPVAPVAVAREREVAVAPNGRRTVLVTGRPDPEIVRTPRPLDAGRRRPAPTLDQKLGHRPDRVAAYAFALGLLLIVVAALTSG